jgi:hypothetical protein
MKKHLETRRPSSRRFFGPVFIAMGVVITFRAVIAPISATEPSKRGVEARSETPCGMWTVANSCSAWVRRDRLCDLSRAPVKRGLGKSLVLARSSEVGARSSLSAESEIVTVQPPQGLNTDAIRAKSATPLQRGRSCPSELDFHP